MSKEPVSLIPEKQGMLPEREKLKTYIIRFRYIQPYDYHTPLMYIPIESTTIKAKNEEDAWKRFITSEYWQPSNYYVKESIYERK